MKQFFKLMLPALLLASCSEEGLSPVESGSDGNGEKVEVVSHGMMVLGDKLENPYSTRNISHALSLVYPTRAEVEVPATSLYVRFLPKSGEEYASLEDLQVQLFDHPLDREIITDGDYYHDPSLPENGFTWQYAVVPADFESPQGIEMEVIERCFIPEEGMVTRGFEDVDWDSVEENAFRQTGNSSLLVPATRAKTKSNPSGRITIKDEKLGKYVGVSGVKMVANVFVKISTTYTDASGNYSFSAKFSAKPKYSICFQNKEGFTIGLNLVLVPASVSAIGKDDPEGIDLEIDSSSDNTLFRRCVVNNAAYDYYQACTAMGITVPPKNIRFWIINKLNPSSTLMMHHGAILDSKLVSNFLDSYKLLVQMFSPDITIGSKNKNGNYEDLYMTATHEMAHTSHFTNVRSGYWNIFASYILSSYLTTGSCYGTGNGEDAGYCEVAEMWAYYMENMIHKDRYGTAGSYGLSNWFRPQVFTNLENGGVTRAEICESLKPSVTGYDELKAELINVCPSKKSLIESTFKRFTR